MYAEDIDTVCRITIEGYRFDLSRVLKAIKNHAPKYIVFEAPQGFVRFLPRLAEKIKSCNGGQLNAQLVILIEPAYGLCSLSIERARVPLSESIIVHIGHDYYPYPFCTTTTCFTWKKIERLITVVGEYIAGDPAKIADSIGELGLRKIVLGYVAQHYTMARIVSNLLSSKNIDVLGVEPVVGCFYENFRKYKGRADGYVIVAGGRFHGLGLGLYFKGDERVFVADPYDMKVHDLSSLIKRTLMKRYWVMREFMQAKRVGVIVGMLPGQYRPGIVDALSKLLHLRGISYHLLYAERVTREVLDNLDPESFDAYIITSCPRLAIEDFDGYWKPVLTPGEARIVLMHGKPVDYSFPW